MSTQEARRLFLARIQRRLADSGKPLSGFALEYWEALEPEDQEIVDSFWKDRKRHDELDSIEKQFEGAIYEALEEDVARDPSATALYLHALDGIKSVEGVQLQAIVFAAAMRVKALQTSKRGMRIIFIVITALILLLGYWLGTLLRR